MFVIIPPDIVKKISELSERITALEERPAGGASSSVVNALEERVTNLEDIVGFANESFGEHSIWLKTSAIITPNWVGTDVPYVQQINIPEVDGTSDVFVSIPDGATAEEINMFQGLNWTDGGQGDGYIILKCWGDKNTENIPITISIRKCMEKEN